MYRQKPSNTKTGLDKVSIDNRRGFSVLYCWPIIQHSTNILNLQFIVSHATCNCSSV